MLRIKNGSYSYFVSAIFLFLLLAGCSNKPKELAPFFDGLYLAYQSERGDGTTSYLIKAMDNGKYKITEKENLLTPKVEQYLVSQYGIQEKSGEFVGFWLPINKMEIGDTVYDYFKAINIEKWKNWETMVFEYPLFSTKIYYDLETGFRVGIEGIVGGVSHVLVLTETNTDLAVE